MTTERDARVLELYREGRLMKHIAAEVGMAPNSIGRVLMRHGIERPSKPQKRWRGLPDETDKIVALWGQGLCASQIAERLACDQSLVDHALVQTKARVGHAPRTRWDSPTPGGPGHSGFAGAMARKT